MSLLLRIPLCRFFLRHMLRFGLAVPGLAWRIQPRLPALRQRAADLGLPRQLGHTLNGAKMRCDLSSHVESQIYWQGVQEADRGQMILFRNLVKVDWVICDLGANVGAIALDAALAAHKGQVHAFEPSPHHMQQLQANAALNGLSNLHFNQMALADAAGTLQLHVPDSEAGVQNSGAASLFGNGQAEDVPVSTLDLYAEEQSLQRLDLIKIDIEGAELLALKGGQQTLRRFKPILLLEINQPILQRAGTSAAELLSFLNDVGYQLQAIERYGNPVPLPDPLPDMLNLVGRVG